MPGRRRAHPDPVRVTAAWNPDKFRASIEAAELSQEYVARAAGLSLRSVQVYLRKGPGAAIPGGAAVVMLARVLKCRAEDWFDVTVTPSA